MKRPLEDYEVLVFSDCELRGFRTNDVLDASQLESFVKEKELYMDVFSPRVYDLQSVQEISSNQISSTETPFLGFNSREDSFFKTNAMPNVSLWQRKKIQEVYASLKEYAGDAQ